MKLKRIVITGAPGTGKTTIIEALKKQGFYCFEEISREVIRQYQKKGVLNPFSTHADEFSDRLFSERILQFKNAPTIAPDIVFYDRAIPDVIAYLNYKKSLIPHYYEAEAKKHQYSKVFTTPPWEAIYTQDNERFETFEDAVRIHEALINTYTELGYQPKIVPTGSVDFRTSFILKNS